MDAIVVSGNFTRGRCPYMKQAGGTMQFEGNVHGVEGLWIIVENGVISVAAIRLLDVGEWSKVDLHLIASHLLWTEQVFLELLYIQ